MLGFILSNEHGLTDAKSEMDLILSLLSRIDFGPSSVSGELGQDFKEKLVLVMVCSMRNWN